MVLYNISDKICIVDASPALLLKDIDSLIIADLHLGIESIMSEDGVYMPFKQTNELVEVLSSMAQKYHIQRLILNGDVKHSFTKPTLIENKEVKRFLEAMGKVFSIIDLIIGNHDVLINWVTRDIKNIKLHSEGFVLGRYYFTHGHKKLPLQLEKQVEYVIIGHEHPIFKYRIRKLALISLPTFLLGPLPKRNVKIIVLPAFSYYSGGTVISRFSNGSLLSPILNEEADISKFETFVLGEDGNVYHFPPFELWDGEI